MSKRFTLVTYICEVGDIHTKTATGTRWYEFYIQTSEKENTRVCSYNTSVHQNLRSYAETKTPVRLVLDRNGETYFFNNACSVSPATLGDVSFPYKQFPSKLHQFKPQEKIPIKDFKDNVGKYGTLSVKVTFDDEPLVFQRNRHGEGKMKHNIIMEDSTGSIVCGLWESTFLALVSGKSFSLTNMCITEFGGKFSCSCTRNTKVKEIDSVVEIGVGADKLKELQPTVTHVTIGSFRLVKDISAIFVCSECRKDIPVDDGSKSTFAQCSSPSCGAKGRVKDLTKLLRGSFKIKVDDQDVWVTVADDSLVPLVDLKKSTNELSDDILELDNLQADYCLSNLTISNVKLVES